jgi:hypothetical protein
MIKVFFFFFPFLDFWVLRRVLAAGFVEKGSHHRWGGDGGFWTF